MILNRKIAEVRGYLSWGSILYNSSFISSHYRPSFFKLANLQIHFIAKSSPTELFNLRFFLTYVLPHLFQQLIIYQPDNSFQ